MGFVFELLWIKDTVVSKCWFSKDEGPLNTQINLQRTKLFIRMEG